MLYMDVDTALAEVPVNVAALIDDTDFKTREESVVYNQAGMDLVWNFVDTGGNMVQTAVTPTTGGVHDWANQNNGMYSLEIPASGGTINNDTEGFGWFTGYATGILPWRGPTICFRAAALNNALIDGGDNLDVNVIQWLGTAVATPTTAGVPEVDMTHLGGAEQSANDLKDFADEGYDPTTNKVQGVVLTDTVTTLTGHTVQTGDNYVRLGAPAGASVSADIAAVKTDTGNLVTRITAALFSGITSLAEWLGLIAGKQVGDATARTEIRATGAGSGTFDETSDALEAIRDRGDAAWVTGGGGAISQIINTTPLIPTSIDLAATATTRLGFMIVNSVDDLPSTAEITPGTVSIDRKPIGGTSWTSIVSDAACSELAGLIYYDEVFDVGAGYAEGDSIRITFKSQSVTADANTFEITGTNGVAFQSEIRQTMRGSDNIVSGSGSINTPATSDSTVITGTVSSGSYADTKAANGVYWQIADDTGAMDVRIYFNVTSTGFPSLFSLLGRITGIGDNLDVSAYDYSESDWVQIGQLIGQATSTDVNYTFDLLNTMVGTGVDTGEVIIRLYAASGLVGAILYIDRLFCSYSVVPSTTGYEGGAIWIDTVNGTSGAVSGVNGTADNPVDNLSDALTLHTALGFHRLRVAQGSQLTFSSTMNNFEIYGIDYEIFLGGQEVSFTSIQGAVVSGTATGGAGSLLFVGCKFGDCSLPEVAIIDGAFAGTFIATEPGEYVLERCFSVRAGATTPTFNFGSLIGNQNLSMRHYSGGIEIQNFNTSGTDNMSLEGHGQLVINSNCAGGSPQVRGHFKITDNTGGAVTPDLAACFDHGEILDNIETDTNEIQGKLPTGDICDDNTPLDTTEVQTSCTNALNAYDPPTRTEATSDKNEIIVQVDANETKIDGLVLTNNAIKAKTDQLPEVFKKNTAFNNFQFAMVQSADDKTPATGLTVSGTYTQDGSGSFSSLAGSISEVANGVYRVNLTSGEMNVNNSLTLQFTATGANTRTITIFPN